MKHTQAQRDRRAALAQRNASPRQREELARRKRMGVGLIEKPLKLIAKRTDTHIMVKGVLTKVESDETKMARIAARIGNGGFVRMSAYHCLRG